jgi:hypothetical protein
MYLAYSYKHGSELRAAWNRQVSRCVTPSAGSWPDGLAAPDD